MFNNLTLTELLTLQTLVDNVRRGIDEAETLNACTLRGLEMTYGKLNVLATKLEKAVDDFLNN